MQVNREKLKAIKFFELVDKQFRSRSGGIPAFFWPETDLGSEKENLVDISTSFLMIVGFSELSRNGFSIKLELSYNCSKIPARKASLKEAKEN